MMIRLDPSALSVVHFFRRRERLMAVDGRRGVMDCGRAGGAPVRLAGNYMTVAHPECRILRWTGLIDETGSMYCIYCERKRKSWMRSLFGI